MPASPPEPRWPRALALAVAASLLVPAEAAARVGPAAEGPAESPGPSEGDAPAPSEAPDTPSEDPAAPADELQPTVTEIEREPAPTGGGVAGAIVDPDDPNAGRAQSDLEGEALDTNIEGLPERLPKLQAAGWWLTFGAVALATSGGIFAGVAETRQDEAERLAYAFDLNTGRASLYADVADEYERVLREGQTYQWVARGLIIAGGATVIAAIVTFAVDARRRKASASASAKLQLDAGPGGLRLRF